MPTFNQNLNLPTHLTTRDEIREWVILEFLKEEAGLGTKELSTKYIYTVEQCATGNSIELRRPAFLNKGMDFTVHVTNIQFRTKGAFKDKPKHQEIIDDLIAKKNHDAKMYEKLTYILQEIYDCQHPQNININIPSGLLSCEEVCLAIKWLWIEQDVTYWNFSGRAMLYQILKEQGLI